LQAIINQHLQQLSLFECFRVLPILVIFESEGQCANIFDVPSSGLEGPKGI
jgi:hypothetical protein